MEDLIHLNAMSSSFFLASSHFGFGIERVTFLQREDGNKRELIFLAKIMLLELAQAAAKESGILAKFHV